MDGFVNISTTVERATIADINKTLQSVTRELSPISEEAFRASKNTLHQQDVFQATSQSGNALRK